MKLTDKDIERFWSGVDRSGGPDDCWIWNGANDRNVYRQFWLNGRNVQATHIALALDGRPLRPGFDALHHCDNKPCCNPRHLYEGTDVDNVRDMYQRGRVHPRTKLTHADVARIEGLLVTTNMSLRTLGKLFGVTHRIIGEIRDGEHQYSKKPSA
jgi:hypothetical protein